MDGTLFIDKPTGMTSFGVVARVRRRLGEEAGHKVKVGHTGTLDPFATGLMILTVGKECKNAATYTKLDKVYEATIQLGQVSSTGDPEGEIASVSGEEPPREAIEKVLQKFTGLVQQTPPAYSAIKINGQRAYKLARKGEAVELPARIVTIYSLELLGYSYPELNIRAHVSSGTYIRSLAEDIGHELEVGAYCKALRRTKIAHFDIARAGRIEEVSAKLLKTPSNSGTIHSDDYSRK